MASIFLSYARDDLGTAEPLAKALTDAGHSVWWDRHLHAGARFSKEIDRALKSADLVVVLWSPASIESAWVHDEASSGRDTGRLVPVLIERVEPPLGFRQYQSVDLSRRRGANAFKPLVDAVAERSGDLSASPPAVPPIVRRRAPNLYLLVGVAAALVMAVTLWFLNPFSNAPSNTVVIAANGGDMQRSTELARTVALDLGRYRAGPLGSLSILSVNDPGASKAEYRVGVGLSGSGNDWSADLALQSRQNSRLLWTTSVKGQGTKLVDLRQQAVSKLVDVLGCLTETQEAGARISDEGRALYLQGCGMLSHIYTSEPSEELFSVFRQLTVKAPEFAAGWANLALLEVQSWPSTAPQDRRALTRNAREHLSRAKQIDPDFPVAIAAEASLPENWQNPSKALSIIESGLKGHPDSALLHGLRSDLLTAVGRTTEAVDEALNAMQLKPLSPADRDRYLSALAYAGQSAKAFDELRKAEAIWPGSEALRQARYRLDLRYGDPKNALRLLQEKGAGDVRPVPMDTAWQSFLEARIDPSPAKIEKALNAFRDRARHNPGEPAYIQALGTFGRVDEAFAALQSAEALDNFSGGPESLFRPHMRSFRADPRFIGLAHRLGLLSFWTKSGVWPDFCRDPQLPYDCRKEASKYR